MADAARSIDPTAAPDLPADAQSRHGSAGGAGSFEVLVLDDSSFDQARIRRACKDTGLPVNTTVVADLDDLGEALDARSYDMVLIDYMLPRGDGLQAQRLVQNHQKNFGAAIVMISSDMRTDVVVESMKNGSLDCLDKDAIDPDRLRDLLMTSAKMFAEASRRWIGELLAQQRMQIAQDVARVVRDEMEFGRFIDTIDMRILETLATHGIAEPAQKHTIGDLDSDEPFRFR